MNKQFAADKNRWRPAMIMFAKSSAWIAAPVVAALFIGKWLDNKYDSAPWLTLICIGASFIISMAGLVRETAKEYKRIESGAKNGAKK